MLLLSILRLPKMSRVLMPLSTVLHFACGLVGLRQPFGGSAFLSRRLIPRFTVLGWAIAEDDDWWLQQRCPDGDARSMPCACGCDTLARSYGHRYLPVADSHLPSCVFPAALISEVSEIDQTDGSKVTLIVQFPGPFSVKLFGLMIAPVSFVDLVSIVSCFTTPNHIDFR